jgi:hypothetical protein
MPRKKIETIETFEEKEVEAIPAARPDAAMVIRIPKKAALALGALLVLLAAFAALAYAMHWWGLGLSEEARAERAVERTVADVGELILLPADETPIVATITDAGALKQDQPFYENAENGDMLLIYNGAQRAILYRPSLDRLVNVAPIYLSGEDAPALPAAE